MEDARAKLIAAALPIFARLGFEGAATRELASAAGRPMSAITYHFGGKEGLYLACAEHIRDTIAGFLEGGVEAQQADGEISAEQAGQQILELFRSVTEVMLGDTADIARFMLREQQEPTAAFDLIWDGIMGRVFGRMTTLIRIIGAGRLSEEEAKIHAVSLMGQVLVFRAAHAALLRLTGWRSIGDEHRAMIDKAVQDNLRCVLTGRR
jgi:TetR/AcrR family transcriptional regulator, regulator of cefoperazone and chloramphenicol sensitivity